MKRCFDEGQVRAYVDGELDPEEMAWAQSHFLTCAECAATHSTVRARSEWVQSGVADLAVCTVPRPLPRRSATKAIWAWGAAIAACLLCASLIMPGRHKTPHAIASAPQAIAAIAAPENRQSIEARPVARSPRRPTRKATPSPRGAEFVLLDHEPIDAGMVATVAIGPEELPAEVVMSADGRFRAIRLLDGETLKNPRGQR